MARVLKQANENLDLWRKEVTCTGAGWEQHGCRPCGSLIEVLATDIVARKYTDISGVTDTYYGFYCPQCGSFTELSFESVPYEIRSMANKRSQLNN